MKIGVFICARLSSSRLPRKHLLEAAGRPLIGWLGKRCQYAFAGEMAVGEAVVAVTTTTEREDRAFDALSSEGIAAFYGDYGNIPLRYLQAADAFGVDAVISVEGDDIFCAPEGMRAVLAGLKEGESGVRTVGLPFGMNLCGYRTEWLRERLDACGTNPPETGWFQALGMDRFPARRFNIVRGGEDIRLTLDYPEDYLLFQRIIEDLGERIVSMSAEEIVFYIRHNHLESINAHRIEDYERYSRERMLAEGLTVSTGTVATSKLWEGSGQELYRRAKAIIPGGVQLLSKRPEMYLPGGWPAYYSRAKGAEIWDLDGRQYHDFTNMSVGACPLGYADPDVDAAVNAAVRDGSIATLNAPEEVQLAELLLELHPWAGAVRYARGGGDSMAVAVRIARATTGRDKVAICGYHGWHDWYLAVNIGDDSRLDGHLLSGLHPAGTPRVLRDTAAPFREGDLTALESIVQRHGDDLAAIVMEPVRNALPPVDYLEAIKRLAHSRGILLVFDEVSAGFRLCCGGSHLAIGVTPDMAVLAKGMSNGYPMGAVLGTKKAMAGTQASFISSTYWTDRVGPAATLACIQKYRSRNVHERQRIIGKKLLDGWEALGKKHDLPIHSGGIPALAHFSIEGEYGLAARTLFTKLMLAKGWLAGPGVYPTWAHTEDLVEEYLSVADGVFAEIAAIGLSDRLLVELRPCEVAHEGFKRLN